MNKKKLINKLEELKSTIIRDTDRRIEDNESISYEMSYDRIAKLETNEDKKLKKINSVINYIEDYL